MAIDREALATRYRAMNDVDLLVLALRPGDLVHEARLVLAEEVAARKGPPRLRRALTIDTDSLSDAKLDLLVAEIQKCRCPECSRIGGSLNAGSTEELAPTPALILGVIDTRINFHIGCTECLKSKGVPGIRKPGPSGRTRPTEAMTDFVFQNAGLFIEFADTPAVLDAILSLNGDATLKAIIDAGSGA